MITAIHQPNFLPWEGYFHKIQKSNIFVILDTVDIEIGTAKAITNRVKIKSPAGAQWMTVPIKKGDSKRINEIEIVNTNWRSKMLKTIQQNYKKAKFYNDFFPVIEDVIQYKTSSLSEYNTYGICKVCKYLRIETKILLASELDVYTDERNERIIEICKAVNSDTYYSGNGGRNYHDENLFIKNGVSIEYTSFKQDEYSQLFGEFIGGLSIIDSLFNKSM